MTLRKTHACVGAIQSSLPYRKRTDLLRPPIAAMPNKTTALKNPEGSGTATNSFPINAAPEPTGVDPLSLKNCTPLMLPLLVVASVKNNRVLLALPAFQMLPFQFQTERTPDHVEEMPLKVSWDVVPPRSMIATALPDIESGPVVSLNPPVDSLVVLPANCNPAVSGSTPLAPSSNVPPVITVVPV